MLCKEGRAQAFCNESSYYDNDDVKRGCLNYVTSFTDDPTGLGGPLYSQKYKKSQFKDLLTEGPFEIFLKRLKKFSFD